MRERRLAHGIYTGAKQHRQTWEAGRQNAHYGTAQRHRHIKAWHREEVCAKWHKAKGQIQKMRDMEKGGNAQNAW